MPSVVQEIYTETKNGGEKMENEVIEEKNEALDAFSLFLTWLHSRADITPEEAVKVMMESLSEENYSLRKRIFREFSNFISETLSIHANRLDSTAFVKVEPVIDHDDLETTGYRVILEISLNGAEVRIIAYESTVFEWLSVIPGEVRTVSELRKAFNETVIDFIEKAMWGIKRTVHALKK